MRLRPEAQRLHALPRRRAHHRAHQRFALRRQQLGVGEFEVAPHHPLGAIVAPDPGARERIGHPAQPGPGQARDQRGGPIQEAGGEIRHAGSLRAACAATERKRSRGIASRGNRRRRLLAWRTRPRSPAWQIGAYVERDCFKASECLGEIVTEHTNGESTRTTLNFGGRVPLTTTLKLLASIGSELSGEDRQQLVFYLGVQYVQ